MKFFSNLFKRNTNEKLLDLENEYLKVSNNESIYGFQKKFYNQSQRLLKIFGMARGTIPNKLKLIVLADTHNSLVEYDLINILRAHPDYDLCILLGDHHDNDIRIVLNNIPKEKIYALKGNHDNDYVNNYSLNNLNGNVVEIKGVKIMGIEGSFKYKPADFPSFTQEESITFLKDKEPVDILFSHDGPFDDNMANNPAHQGLFGITYYLYKNRVKYNLHGHLHNEYRKDLINGTKEISLFGASYIELD